MQEGNETPDVDLTAAERDIIDQLLDMYAENPSNRNKYRHSMYFVAQELKNGRSPVEADDEQQS